MRFKKIIISLLLTVVIISIGLIFWYSEFLYQLPTPIPKNYKPITLGSTIGIPNGLSREKDKPLFLHFFNPDCPCSKFNTSHFKSLIKQFKNKATFAIVVVSNKNFTKEQIQQQFRLNVPVLFDTGIAVACGVYSTPQAVIIDNSDRLYYRGNYNRSRYCSDKKSAYAFQALDKLLHNNKNTVFNPYALIAYGCQLPVRKKVI